MSKRMVALSLTAALFLSACGMSALAAGRTDTPTDGAAISAFAAAGTGDNEAEWDPSWSDEEKTVRGQCGDNLTWKLHTETGVLTLDGRGRMWNRSGHEDSFWDNDAVKSVVFGGAVMSIGDDAFRDCPHLTQIALPESVQSIGQGAFANNACLQSVTIPAYVTSIGNDAFAGCDALMDYYYAGTENEWAVLADKANFVPADGAVVHCSYTWLLLTAQPADVTVMPGRNTTFSVEATGQNLTYQWYYRKAGASDWSVWKGHTTASTSAAANETWDGMRVYCAVRDGSGHSISSRQASITVVLPLTITSQPQNVVTQAGRTVSFSVRATGKNPTYQWYYKKAGSSDWRKWNGHTTSTTTATANATWNGMQVYCVVQDALGRTVSSDPAAVTLSEQTSVLLQPENVTAGVGETVTFRVKASGSGLRYQWYYKKRGAADWSIWKNHTAAATAATANATWDGMQVCCAVTDANGATVKSNAATVTIAALPTITAQPQDITLQPGSMASFTVKATENGLTYQWYYKKAGAAVWSRWNGHTTATTTAIANATWDGMQVYCVIEDTAGRRVNSRAAVITLG